MRRRTQGTAEVIDNCLNRDYITFLMHRLLQKDFKWIFIPWEDQDGIEDLNHETDMHNYWFTHCFYAAGKIQSEQWDIVEVLLDTLKKQYGLRKLLRLKANLYPFTHEMAVHKMHRDYVFPNTAAILSLNTCDGYTTLADETQIGSEENRLIIFDGQQNHCSSSTTNAKARLNIIVNYLE